MIALPRVVAVVRAVHPDSIIAISSSHAGAWAVAETVYRLPRRRLAANGYYAATVTFGALPLHRRRAIEAAVAAGKDWSDATRQPRAGVRWYAVLLAAGALAAFITAVWRYHAG